MPIKNAEINAKIAEMEALNAEIKELEALVEAIKDSLKGELDSTKQDEINTGKYVIRYKLVESNRLDTSKFKKEQADMYAAYSKSSITTRFTYDEVA